ncbi:MAG: hypothetical protein D6782_12405 [Alphaproteobacteria bacterium]|nr:MAG: hypothetical protein D6782_12405 [Alphaproteobacteria bacterium]
MGVPAARLQVAAQAPAHYHPGQAGALSLGPKAVLAHFGVLHPSVLAHYGIKLPVAAAELYLDAVPQPKQVRRSRPPLAASDLQAVNRDFAFLVPKDTPAGAVLDAARNAARDAIADIGLFDVYVGKGVPENMKSLAIFVTLQPQGTTFTDEQIEAIASRIVAAVGKATGATLRV